MVAKLRVQIDSISFFYLDSLSLCFHPTNHQTSNPEMKITRPSLPRTLAVPTTYDSFFSLPASKLGYSGVGVYTNSQRARPLKAEEGLTGSIYPTALKPPWNAGEERISNAYPRAYDLDLFPDEEDNTPNDLHSLDNEGRALTLDFGLFVLINTYCPNETSDARLPYKMNYHLMLQARVDQLIKEGREVIVLGDLNICAQPLDHCDGHLESVKERFWEHPARKWSKAWFGEGGVLVDIVRQFWPERKAMCVHFFPLFSLALDADKLILKVYMFVILPFTE
jgi:AP endonuclease 2